MLVATAEKNLLCQIATQSDSTEHHDVVVLAELAETSAQVVERYVHGSVYGAESILRRRAHIHQTHLRPVERGNLAPCHYGHHLVQRVACHVAGYRHRVFCRSERRSISLLGLHEVAHGAAHLYEHGYLVYAFVHAFHAHTLRAVDASGVGSEG